MARWFNLIVDQGTSFTNDFALLDSTGANLVVTGYVANAALKPYYTYGTAVAFETELSEGQVTISLDANTSSNLAPGRYVYDVKVVDPEGFVIRVVEGQVTVVPKVT